MSGEARCAGRPAGADSAEGRAGGLSPPPQPRADRARVAACPPARASPPGPTPARPRSRAHARPPTLAHLHAVEPGLQPELLNHLLHGGDARGTRHGALDSRADSSVRARGGRSRGGGRGSELRLSFRCCARRACAPRPAPRGPRRLPRGREPRRRGGAAGGRGGDGGGAARRPAGAFRVRRGWFGRGKKDVGCRGGRAAREVPRALWRSGWPRFPSRSRRRGEGKNGPGTQADASPGSAWHRGIRPTGDPGAPQGP